MNYGVNGSGANPNMAQGALRTYFRYDSAIAWERRSSPAYTYTAAEWFDLIKAEINANRPMLYAIYHRDPGTGDIDAGHGIVCDGWRDTGPNNEYHMNYGWRNQAFTTWWVLDTLTFGPLGPSSTMDELLLADIEPDQTSTPPWRKRVSVPYYEQEDGPGSWEGSGAATAKMVVETWPEPKGEGCTLSQYRTFIEANREEGPPAFSTDPVALRLAIRKHDPRWTALGEDWWRIYEYTDPHLAAAESAYSMDVYDTASAGLWNSGDSWGVIVGVQTDVQPRTVGLCVTVERVMIYDPQGFPGGVQWMSAATYRDFYMTQNLRGQRYLNKWVVVADPDPVPCGLPYERPEPCGRRQCELTEEEAIDRANELVYEDGLFHELAGYVAEFAVRVDIKPPSQDIAWWVGFVPQPEGDLRERSDQVCAGMLIDEDQWDILSSYLPAKEGWSQDSCIEWEERHQHFPYLNPQQDGKFYIHDVGTVGACCIDGDCQEGCVPSACLALGGIYQGDDTTCQEVECLVPIPTVSEWGLVVLTLLLLTGAKVHFGRKWPLRWGV